MQWKVNKSSTMRLTQAFTEETQGKPAPIREFEVTSVMAMLHPIEKADGAWKDGSYADYSAIAFAFAHKLHKGTGRAHRYPELFVQPDGNSGLGAARGFP